MAYFPNPGRQGKKKIKQQPLNMIKCTELRHFLYTLFKAHQDKEIVFYENVEDVPIQERGLTIVETHSIEMTKMYKEVFMPKAKHLPKGHERPYKFHK
jgi:hypothetical protein